MDWGSLLTQSLQQALGPTAVIYALAAIGLNIHFGYTGMLNFGQAGFMMVCGYTMVGLATILGVSLWVGFAAAILATVVLALVLGVPTLRLRGDYLAIVTIAASEIVRLTLRSVTLREWTGGSFGLQQFARDFYAINPLSPGTYGFGWLSYNERAAWFLLVAWGLVAVSTLMVYVLMHSPWGRVLRAIREDEDAARSLGKNVYYYKMQSLVLGGVLGGLGGFMLAINTQSVQPDVYSPPITFFLYTVLILGGAARVLGPVVGAVLFWLLLSLTDSVLRQAVGAGYIPSAIMSGTDIGIVRFMLVGAGLMLLMIFRPQGIFGDRRELALDE